MSETNTLTALLLWVFRNETMAAFRAQSRTSGTDVEAEASARRSGTTHAEEHQCGSARKTPCARHEKCRAVPATHGTSAKLRLCGCGGLRANCGPEF